MESMAADLPVHMESIVVDLKVHMESIVVDLGVHMESLATGRRLTRLTQRTNIHAKSLYGLQ